MRHLRFRVQKVQGVEHISKHAFGYYFVNRDDLAGNTLEIFQCGMERAVDKAVVLPPILLRQAELVKRCSYDQGADISRYDRVGMLLPRPLAICVVVSIDFSRYRYLCSHEFIITADGQHEVSSMISIVVP